MSRLGNRLSANRTDDIRVSFVLGRVTACLVDTRHVERSDFETKRIFSVASLQRMQNRTHAICSCSTKETRVNFGAPADFVGNLHLDHCLGTRKHFW